MRVITGTKRGIRLETLQGEAVRPTLEKTKEAVFSAIQFDIEGRRILDLFAGSGQLGIEALSRGAEKAVFIDSSAESIEVVKRNIEKTGLEKQSVICRADALSFIKTTKEVFDIAFLDPPYNSTVLQDTLSSVFFKMSDYGIIICEHSSNEDMPKGENGFSISKQYNYGKLVTVTIYRKSMEG